MIVTVTLNPAVDHQVFVDQLALHDTNRVVRTEIDAGGKGINMSRVFAELGGETTATGFIGGNAAPIIERVLTLQGVKQDFVHVDGETRTNVSIEDNSGNPPTTFNARGPHISEGEWVDLMVTVRNLSKNAEWVCLGGSLPPGVQPDSFGELGRIAKESGAKVLLDADGEPCRLGMKSGPDFIKPNAKEASRLLGRPVDTTEEAIDGAKELLADLMESYAGSDDPSLPMVIISRGEDGAVLACPLGIFVGASAPVDAKSSIGSGDSFLGGMLWAMSQGCSLSDSFAWGLAAGAATATTDGTEIARKRVTELLFRHCSVEKVG